MSKSSIQSQLSILLGNIEATYLNLVSGNKWEGITASPPASSFIANGPIDDDYVSGEAQVLAAKEGMPWDAWVCKFAECHHCGKKGHIRTQCQDYLKKLKSGKLKRPV